MINTVGFSSFENPITLQPFSNTQRLIFQVEQGKRLNDDRKKAEAAYIEHVKMEEGLAKHNAQMKKHQRARETKYI